MEQDEPSPQDKGDSSKQSPESEWEPLPLRKGDIVIAKVMEYEILMKTRFG